MQEDVIDDVFDPIYDFLLSVVIKYEGERLSENFEANSVVEWIDVRVVLSKYRGQNCICLDQYHIPCW